jgi:hypothetical protein
VAAPTANVINPTPVWTQSINDSGSPIWFSSPGVGNLDGKGPAVIVGNEKGSIYAFHVSDGSPVAGWPYKQAYSVQSTPAVGVVAGTPHVFLGVGTSATFRQGGYLAINSTGKLAWFRNPIGVMSSLAFGHLQGVGDVVGGSMAQSQWAMSGKTGTYNKGFPWFQADTNFSSPALADLNDDGHDEIIEGGDSTKGVAHGYSYQSGGHIRILSYRGNSGQAQPNGGLKCQYNTTQVVQSSPAVGGFLAGGATGIVVGTGDYYKNPSDNHKLIAINTSCKKIWSRDLGSSTHPSPAIADVDGDGTLDVVSDGQAGGVFALNGTNGATKWHFTEPFSAQGSITTFQAPGAKFQYVLVPTSHGLYVLDGRNGSQVEILATNVQLRNSATATADPDGSLGVTIAGISSGHSVVEHFAVTGSKGVLTAATYGAWPMFHHDPQLTGYAPHVATAP